MIENDFTLSLRRLVALISGLAFGSHLLLSSFEDFYKIKIFVPLFSFLFLTLLGVNFTSNRLGLLRDLIAFVKKYRLVTLAILLFFFLGLVGEHLRAQGNPNNHTCIDYFLLLDGTISLREHCTSMFIITRWFSYIGIVFLAVYVGGLKYLLFGFVVGNIGQLAFVPIDHYVGIASQIANTYVIPGIEWQAINRAYLGYEVLVGVIFAASYGDKFPGGNFLSLILAMLSTFVVILSGSKGPFLALLFLSTIFISFKYFNINKMGISFLLNAVFVLSYAVILLFGLDFASRLPNYVEIDLRMSESFNIRAQIIKNSAWFNPSSLWEVIFGNGFGWSRYANVELLSNPTISSGSHVMIFDFFADTGLLGLACLMYSVIKITGQFSEFSTKQDCCALILLFNVFCVKMMVASDSYSEPIFFLLVGALLALKIKSMQAPKMERNC